MCGRYLLRASKKDIGEAFEIDQENLPVIRYGRYNIAPTQDVPGIIFDPQSGLRELHLFRWGLIPSWAKDMSVGNTMINARSETVQEKPSFRNAFRKRRCLLLADGFYEWKTIEKKKQPFLISLKDQALFAFAGIYEIWKDPEGKEIRSCSILTRGANTFMREIHDRMPVILRSPEEWNAWLDPANAHPETLLEAVPEDALIAYAVSTLVNNPRNDSEDCLRAAEGS